MDIYSLIGSGNPSCLSITGVCNEMAEQHREGWRERISLFDIFKISLSVCKWRILPVILVYFFNLRLIIVIPSKFIFFVIKNRRVSLLASPVVLWQRHWHLCCIRSPSGMIESTPLLFGDSWRVPSACTPSTAPPCWTPVIRTNNPVTQPILWDDLMDASPSFPPLGKGRRVFIYVVLNIWRPDIVLYQASIPDGAHTAVEAFCHNL